MPNAEMQLIDDKNPILPCSQTLDDLFAGYQGDYQPTEIDTGVDVGREQIS